MIIYLETEKRSLMIQRAFIVQMDAVSVLSLFMKRIKLIIAVTIEALVNTKNDSMLFMPSVF